VGQWPKKMLFVLGQHLTNKMKSKVAINVPSALSDPVGECNFSLPAFLGL